MSQTEERKAALEPQDEGDLQRLGTLVDTPWWAPLRKVLLRVEDNAIEDLVDESSPKEELSRAQGKVQVVRSLLDLLENDAPAAYQLAQERERTAARDE